MTLSVDTLALVQWSGVNDGSSVDNWRSVDNWSGMDYWSRVDNWSRVDDWGLMVSDRGSVHRLNLIVSVLVMGNVVADYRLG